MHRVNAGFRLINVALALGLLLSGAGSGWADTASEDICNTAADFPLGLEDYATAIALHRAVLREHSDNALAHYHLGFAYGMTGHPSDEIGEYLAAARLGLHKWDLFLNLGIAYLDRKDWPNAIAALRVAVALGPNHPEAHSNLAIAYERERDLGQALQEITASLSLAPLDADAGNTKAIICAEMGDRVCARDEWVYLVRVNPGYAPARLNLRILGVSPSSLAVASSAGVDCGGLAFEH